MSRPPDRTFPKVTLQANIRADIREGIEHMASDPATPCSSLSQLTETLLFLAKHTYLERGDGEFEERLVHVRAHQLLAHPDATRRLPKSRIHLTVDREARIFLDQFTALHPGLCRSKADTLELIFSYALLCHTTRQAHFLRRLEDVRLLHP